MNQTNSNSGFTLLEIIIAVIIMGVLAALALPRLFPMRKNAQASEGITAFKLIRAGMDSCFMQNGENYVGCNSTNWDALGVDDPAAETGARFAAYTIDDTSFDMYTVIAVDAEDAANILIMTVDRPANPAVRITGEGAFASFDIDSNT